MIGARVVRVEDPRLLTVGGTYTEDLVDESLTGAVHVTFVRSPFAHARVLGVDTAAALERPGVVAVVTAADLAGLPPIPPPASFLNPATSRPLLADGTVRFVGEPVAAVVTEDRYAGQDAAELVGVDYDPLPAVIGARAAAASEVLLFPEAGSNVVCTFGSEPPPGDDPLFEGCEVVVRRELVNQRLAPAPLEGRAAAAAVGPDGRLTVWLPNQGAQHARDELSRMLGLPAGQLRVRTPDVGGGFGAKFDPYPEYAVVCWLARRLGRPVRWVETRSENLVAMTHGRAQDQLVTIGGSRDGRVQAYRLEITQDAGAYPAFGALLPTLTQLMTPGVYDLARVESSARSVVTNTTPVAAYRGAGRPEATYALERAIDLFAAEIGMDPADVRRKNLLPAFDQPHETPTGARYDSGDYPAALERALAAAGYPGLRAEQARRRAAGDPIALGVGMAVYVEVTGAGMEAGPPNENATVTVHPDGAVTVLTGTSPHGQGHATAWAMLASAELGIPMERITVLHGDTDLIPRGSGTAGSRSLQQGGMAVQQAARELVELARQRAADLLEADPEDLELDPDRAAIVVRGAPDAAVTLAELAGRESLEVHAVFSAPGPTFPFGAHVAVVEVDTESGKVALRRLVCVDDAGTVLNPLLAEGQRHGGLAQGVAQALYEEVRYDPDGNPLTATLAHYPFLPITEVPDFELVEMATPTRYNPLGAKGIGESGTIGSTPAVLNAVVDALAQLGVRHLDMPATPERVWAALHAARDRSAGPPARSKGA